MLLGLVNHWPDQISAEAEFITRLRAALTARGHDSFVIDNSGKIISESSRGSSANLSTADAVLVFDPRPIYFTSPAPLISPVWIPPELLPIEARIDFISALKKIDIFIGGYDSEKLFEAYRNALERHNRKLEPLTPFCASVPLAFSVKPHLMDNRRLFYAGVNSERIAHINGRTETRPGRHNELFKLLDTQPYIDFYGPQKFGGIVPWAGFSSYRGDISTDGHGVLNVISQCGISLCISSQAHLKYGIVSNRIFEAAAAGAVIISDKNEFVENNFGDAAYYIDTQDPHVAFQQINNIVAEINANPQAALERAQRGHKIYCEKFSLDTFCDVLQHKIEEARAPRPNPAVALIIDAEENVADIISFVKQHGIHYVAFINRDVFASTSGKLPFECGRFANLEEFIYAAADLKIEHFIAYPKNMRVKPTHIDRLVECSRVQSHAAVILCSSMEFACFPLPDPEIHFLKMYFWGLQDIEILRPVSSLFCPGFALINIDIVRKAMPPTAAQSTTYRNWLYTTLLQESQKQAKTVHCAAGVTITHKEDKASEDSHTDDMEWLFEKGLNISPSPELTSILSSATLSKCIVERSLSWRFSHFDQRHYAYDMQLRPYNNFINKLYRIRNMLRRIRSGFRRIIGLARA